ncbi:glycosyltransferase [Candidatus Peregrinibacteria bacterium]|nr:glycosyltransferase [Candidatus Peregrinibacteria bacterium]
MKVFMLGWEFAPIKSGGLGVACRGIAEGLECEGVDVVFALPSYLNPNEDKQDGRIKIVSKRMKKYLIPVDEKIVEGPYLGSNVGATAKKFMEIEVKPGQKINHKNMYGPMFWKEIAKFSEEAKALATENPHDIIHVHDWMTYQAGAKVKEVSGKPLIAHVHATEMDRTGGNPNEYIYQLEKQGYIDADHIIVVSEHTKRVLELFYDIPGTKISVVHNAHIKKEDDHRFEFDEDHFSRRDKIVLFLGRVTLQKGPEYFVEVAKKVLSKRKDVKFVLAGHGDMMPKIINMIIDNGLQENIFCAGFLSGNDLERAFYHSKLYVMPSVSEPFGISALEAVEFGTPVLMSKTSGAVEVVRNSLRADFWDIEKMANQVIAIIDYPVLGKTLVRYAKHETKYLTWHQQSKKIHKIYQDIKNA